MATISGTRLGYSSSTPYGPNSILDGAYGVQTVTVGGRVFVYSAARGANALAAFELKPDGSLTNIQYLQDSQNPSTALGGISNFATAVIGGVTYLFANSFGEDALTQYRVQANGTLIQQNVLFDSSSSSFELFGTQGKMSISTSGSQTFLYVTGVIDDGVSIFTIGSNGALSFPASYDDASNASHALNGAGDSAAITVGGNTFTFVTASVDSGLSIFRSGGVSVFLGSLFDTPTLELAGASGVATATVAGTGYVFVSGQTDDGISVFSVNSAGTLTNVFNITDNGASALDGVNSLTTFQSGGQTYLAATSSVESAISYFQVAANGFLTQVSVAFDDATAKLQGARYSTYAAVGGTEYLIASGSVDDGLAVYEIGGGVDTLDGTADADTLNGRGGADILNGNGGADVMNGGTGADVMRGGVGNDTYSIDNASDQAIENAGEGDDVIYTTISYDMRPSIESLVMQGSADLRTNGNELANYIFGNNAFNYINGGAGTDVMSGGLGNDTYSVDNSFDVVAEDLGGGDDAVYSSVDVQLFGNVETLLLTGSAVRGFGDSSSNQIFGNAGLNIIDGRGGADLLQGFGGDDIFVFQRGEASGDVIVDFTGAGAAGGDRIAFGGYSSSAQVFQVSATSWEIRDQGLVEQFVLQNGAVLTTDDYYFA